MNKNCSDKYVKKILQADVYDVAEQTPLESADNLSGRLANVILLKREDLQPVFSFKLRGAYNKIKRLSAAEKKSGVITASAGNHAQGVALQLGVDGRILQGVDVAASEGREVALAEVGMVGQRPA